MVRQTLSEPNNQFIGTRVRIGTSKIDCNAPVLLTTDRCKAVLLAFFFFFFFFFFVCVCLSCSLSNCCV